MKDAEDLRLEALFASEPIADGGFSAGVRKRIQRTLWVRRMALPVAVLIGGLLSAKALAGLLSALLTFLSVLPKEVSVGLSGVAEIGLPQASTLLLGVVVAFGFMMAAKMLEEV